MAAAGGIALDPESRSPEPVGFTKWGESFFLPHDGSNIPLLVILSFGYESDEERFDCHPAAQSWGLGLTLGCKARGEGLTLHGMNGRPSPAGLTRVGVQTQPRRSWALHRSARSGPRLLEPPARPAAHCLVLGGSEQPLFCTHLIPSFPHQIICNRHQAIGPVADSISALCCHSRFSAPG